MKTNTSEKTAKMVLTSLLTALIFILAFVPFAGYIRIPVLAIQVTTVHIPVIIGSIILGPKYGAFLGGCFGLTSLINNTAQPGITSFVFSPFIEVGEGLGGSPLSLIICFVPRILSGIVPYFVYIGMQKIMKKNRQPHPASLMISGVAGSMTNTLLVMGMIYLFFGKEWAAAKNIAYEAVLGIIGSVVLINGTIEAFIAAVFSSAVCLAILKTKNNKGI